MNRTIVKFFFIGVIIFSSLFAGDKNSNKNIIEEKVESTLAQLTLEEKVKLTHGYGNISIGKIDRLGIPLVTFTDGSQGVREDTSTAFPAGIAMVASWDIELMEKVGERSLREIYLPALRMAVEEGKVWSMMSSYNQVNGVFGSANKHLQQDIVKDEWGCDGVMMSDWNEIHFIFGSALDGLDLEMPGGKSEDKHFFCTSLLRVVQNNEISVSIIDDKVRRILRLIYRTTIDATTHVKANTKENQNVARELAEKSIVLLKNDEILPLDKTKLKSIAVIGSNADKLHHVDRGYLSGGSGAVIPPYEISPLA